MTEMPKRLTPEKTTFINVGGTMVPISTLPSNIAQEFLLIDAMKSEAAQITYRLEILSLAIKGKSQELANAVARYMIQQAEQNNTQTGDPSKAIDK